MEEECLPAEEDVFQVDEGLDPLAAVLRYSFSTIQPQRLAYIKGIAAAAASVADEQQLHELLEALTALLADVDDAVRAVAIEQLHAFGCALQQLSVQYGWAAGMLVTCLELAADALRNEGPELRTPVISTLCALCGLVVHTASTPLIDQLLSEFNEIIFAPGAQQGADSSAAASCVELLTSCAQHMELEVLAGTAAPLLARLCMHEDASVRETISGAVPVLVQWLVLGRASIAVIEALVQAWGGLCSDSMWLVRKACAAACPTLLQALSAPMLLRSSTTDASIVSAAEATAPETAQLQALQTHIVQDCYLGKLCKDVSQWVRSAAIAQAGPVLTALPASSLQPPAGSYLGHALLEQFAAAAALVGAGSAAAQAASARSFLGVCKQVWSAEAWQTLWPVLQLLLSLHEPQVVCPLLEATPPLLTLLNKLHRHPANTSNAANIASVPASASEVVPAVLAAARTCMPRSPAIRLALAHAMLPMLQAAPAALRGTIAQELPELCAASSSSSSTRPGASACGEWRVRHTLAQQLYSMLHLLEQQPQRVSGPHKAGADSPGTSTTPTIPSTTQDQQQGELGQQSSLAVSVMLPLAIELCVDPAWAVRHAAACQLGWYIQATMLHTTADDMDELRGAAASAGQVLRATAVEMAGGPEPVRSTGMLARSQPQVQAQMAQLQTMLQQEGERPVSKALVSWLLGLWGDRSQLGCAESALWQDVCAGLHQDLS